MQSKYRIAAHSNDTDMVCNRMSRVLPRTQSPFLIQWQLPLLFFAFGNNNNNNSERTAHTELSWVIPVCARELSFISIGWGRWCEFNNQQKEMYACSRMNQGCCFLFDCECKRKTSLQTDFLQKKAIQLQEIHTWCYVRRSSFWTWITANVHV